MHKENPLDADVIPIYQGETKIQKKINELEKKFNNLIARYIETCEKIAKVKSDCETGMISKEEGDKISVLQTELRKTYEEEITEMIDEKNILKAEIEKYKEIKKHWQEVIEGKPEEIGRISEDEDSENYGSQSV